MKVLKKKYKKKTSPLVPVKPSYDLSIPPPLHLPPPLPFPPSSKVEIRKDDEIIFSA